MNRFRVVVWAVAVLLCIALPALAQDELAATLEVLSPGVEVLRVNTSNWIAVNLEAIVGVGDVIRTDSGGRARITYFADGTDTEIQPNSEYRIAVFNGSETQFNISAELLVGQTIQRLSRLLDAGSTYQLITPGMSLGARGTAFEVRVEQNGRSAMLVREGLVAAAAQEEADEVAPGFGIRADAASALSDVVQASTFAELDAAIDGCPALLTTPDDVSLNIRQGAGRDYPRIGVIDAAAVTTLFGVTDSGEWYRIPFNGGFGWILSSNADVADGCAGLRTFPDAFGPEDPALYTALGDAVTVDDLLPAPSESP
ncbi:MAG: FecR domain-containing protein [bacterium]|nr:FecR domain-containing protein [bacterium]